MPHDRGLVRGSVVTFGPGACALGKRERVVNPAAALGRQFGAKALEGGHVVSPAVAVDQYHMPEAHPLEQDDLVSHDDRQNLLRQVQARQAVGGKIHSDDPFGPAEPQFPQCRRITFALRSEEQARMHDAPETVRNAGGKLRRDQRIGAVRQVGAVPLQRPERQVHDGAASHLVQDLLGSQQLQPARAHVLTPCRRRATPIGGPARRGMAPCG